MKEDDCGVGRVAGGGRVEPQATGVHHVVTEFAVECDRIGGKIASHGYGGLPIGAARVEGGFGIAGSEGVRQRIRWFSLVP